MVTINIIKETITYKKDKFYLLPLYVFYSKTNKPTYGQKLIGFKKRYIFNVMQTSVKMSND